MTDRRGYNVNIFAISKHLRRRMRRWRRAIWTGLACFLVAIMAWKGLALSKQMEALMTSEPIVKETLGLLQDTKLQDEVTPDWLKDIQRSGQAKIVHLSKKYICGEETTVLGIMKPDEITSLLKEHPDWIGRIGNGGDVWLEEHVNALSTECERNGYFGIDRLGNLSLFDGSPKEEKVLKTFFQLDVETMESVLPQKEMEQIRKGIRVQDVEEFDSVLSTFSEFAVGATEGVITQTESK